MFSTTSPNMFLTIPTVGSEAGPLYATDINNSLGQIDSHNHTAGFGVAVPTLGININANLPFNSFAATNVLALQMFTQPLATTLFPAISVAPESGNNELWYNDGVNAAFPITKEGAVNVSASSIPGESFSGSSFIWVQTQATPTSKPTTPADFQIASVFLQPAIAATTFYTRLAVNSALSTQWTLTLPADKPAATAFLTMDTAGNMTNSIGVNGVLSSANLSASANIAGTQLSASANILSTQLANPNSILGTQIGALTITDGNVGNVSGSKINAGTVPVTALANAHYVAATIATTSTISTVAFTTVAALSISLPSSAAVRPVFIAIQPAQLAAGTPMVFNCGGGGMQYRVVNTTSGQVIWQQALFPTPTTPTSIQAASLNFYDFSSPSGSNTYIAQIISEAGDSVNITGGNLFVMQE